MKKLAVLLVIGAMAAPAFAHAAVEASETPRVNACPTVIPSVRWDGNVMIPCLAEEMRGF
ncbi:MAG TPA: hypothetical protein VFW39_06105 [Sphingomicrobium sp.]|nr:hypothetical protein [Sphingomicrobium sp.]